MQATRKRYSADFKAKVALEAIRGDLTLAELASNRTSRPRMSMDGIGDKAGGTHYFASDGRFEKPTKALTGFQFRHVRRDTYGTIIKQFANFVNKRC